MVDPKIFDTAEFNEQYYYDGDDLGSIYTKEKTTFRLWSPLATKVTLLLYDKGYKSKPYDKIKMNKDVKGTWFVEVKEDLHGVFYTYEIEIDNKKVETVDIYAKACGVNGERGMVIDLSRTNPEGFLKDKRPELINSTDAIIYETHIRDFTIHKTSNVSHPGKFLGLAQKNTRSPEGLTTGLDHLIELGITHVHLLPVFDFASIDENKLDKPQYNWGYDPLNYNCIEGSYSTNPIDGEARIKEFKTLVQALHKSNIRVIMDVVYNHTYLTVDSYFNKTFPNYYYRQINGEFADGSACGNEVASERLMVRKYIIDSVKYFAKEYHIDGFRFDLMGLHDIETMNLIRQELDKIDPSIIIYGEGWVANESPLPVAKRAIKENIHKLPRIAAFNDDFRDGVKGHVFYNKQPGFVNGGVGFEETVKFGIVAATKHPQIDYEKVIYAKKPWATQPNQCINYVSCHDNLCLYDKIVETTEDLDITTRIKMVKMANALVLTSQGIPFMFAGDEMLRTKNGDENSYKSPDIINQIVWHSKYDHFDLFEYCRGLIKLRKKHPAFRMTSTEMIQNHLKFLPSPVTNTIAYNITGSANNDSYADIVVLFNANVSEVKFKLPHFGVWNIVVDQDKAGVEVLRKFTGSEVVVPSLSTYVLYSNEKLVSEVTIVEKKRTDVGKYAKYALGALGLYWLLRRRRRK